MVVPRTFPNWIGLCISCFNARLIHFSLPPTSLPLRSVVPLIRCLTSYLFRIHCTSPTRRTTSSFTIPHSSVARSAPGESFHLLGAQPALAACSPRRSGASGFAHTPSPPTPHIVIAHFVHTNSSQNTLLSTSARQRSICTEVCIAIGVVV